MDLNKVSEGLKTDAKQVVDIFTNRSTPRHHLFCTLNDAKEFDNGVKAFVLDIRHTFESVDRKSCLRRSDKLIVAIVPGDDMLWFSNPTIYQSSSETIPENWARSNSYSKLSSCRMNDNSKLEFTAYVADYYNFCSDVVAQRSNSPI